MILEALAIFVFKVRHKKRHLFIFLIISYLNKYNLIFFYYKNKVK